MAHNKDLYKICEGCSGYGSLEIFDNEEKYYRGCFVKYPIMSSTSQCPCITCIVKGICNNNCKDYKKYVMLSIEKDERKNDGQK